MKTLQTAFALSLLALALSACAPMTPAPTTTSRPEESGPPPQTGERLPQAPATPVPKQPAHSAVSSLLEQGWSHYQRENYPAALTSAERAQRIDPRSPEVYLLMASTQFSLYRLSLAEQLARRGLALAPTGTVIRGQLQSLLAKIAAAP